MNLLPLSPIFNSRDGSPHSLVGRLKKMFFCTLDICSFSAFIESPQPLGVSRNAFPEMSAMFSGSPVCFWGFRSVSGDPPQRVFWSLHNEHPQRISGAITIISRNTRVEFLRYQQYVFKDSRKGHQRQPQQNSGRKGLTGASFQSCMSRLPSSTRYGLRVPAGSSRFIAWVSVVNLENVRNTKRMNRWTRLLLK